MKFEWHSEKDHKNIELHGIGFDDATVFLYRQDNRRNFNGRFTVRENSIRIFGAGFWRKGRKRYEEENNIL